MGTRFHHISTHLIVRWVFFFFSRSVHLSPIRLVGEQCDPLALCLRADTGPLASHRLMSTHWTIIANPISGRGQATRVGERIAGLLHRRGVGADLMVSKARGDCERLTREALARGARQVAACGGDGTIHEVINGLAHSDAVLGIVPCGRGNDLARALGLPKDVNGVVNALMHGRVRAMDLGKVGARFFATVASLGFDTAVARRVRAQTLRLGGTMAYGLAILQTLVGYRASRVRLIGDFGVLAGAFCWRQRRIRLFTEAGSKLHRVP